MNSKAPQGNVSRRRASAAAGWCLALLLCFMGAPVAAQQADDRPATPSLPSPHNKADQQIVREIYVPSDQIPVLLNGSPDHVFLTREQYEQLIEQATQRPSPKAPVAATVNQAHYRIVVQDGRAEIEATLSVEGLDPGWNAIPLMFHGVGLRRALLDGQPAPLGRSRQGQMHLFLNGRGRHSLEMSFTAAVAVHAAHQTMSLEVPSAPATTVQLLVPGNVELRSGVRVVARHYDAATDVTHFDLLADPGQWNFVLSLNNRILQRERLVVATNAVVDTITRGREYVSITSTFTVLHGAVERLEWRIPKNLEVHHVDSEWLSRWEIAADSDEQLVRLVAHLRAPTSDVVKVTILGERATTMDSSWTFPSVDVIDVAGSVTVVGLLAETPLELAELQTEKLTPIDAELASQLASSTALATTNPVRPVAAFYAPGPNYRITGQVRLPQPRVDVLSSFTLHVDRSHTKVAGVITLVPKHDRLFQFGLIAPAAWNIMSVTDAAKQPLPFQTFPLDSGDKRIVVRTTRPVSPNESYPVMFTAVAQLPGWTEEWEQRQLVFPTFRVENAASDRGALVVLAAGDLDVRPTSLDNLSPLDADERQQFGVLPEAPLAFRFDSSPFGLILTIERLRPRLVARTYSFLRVSNGQMAAHYEVIYTVRESTDRHLAIALPKSTPSEVSIRGLAETAVREYHAVETATERIWQIMLTEDVQLDPVTRTGKAHVAVEFQTPLPATITSLPLPIIRAENVALQWGYLAVEGDPEREMRLETSARRVDPAELYDASYRPGPHLIGAYSFTAVPTHAELRSEKRSLHGLPAAVVERAEIRSLLSIKGDVHSVARYHVRTKLTWLQLRLPKGAGTLWAVSVDDQPITPQRTSDAVLIHLPPGSDQSARRITVAYDQSTGALGWRSRIALEPPELLVPAGTFQETAVPVPATDLEWKLLLPPGYAVSRVDDAFSWNRPKRHWLVASIFDASLLPMYATRVAAPPLSEARSIPPDSATPFALPAPAGAGGRSEPVMVDAGQVADQLAEQLLTEEGRQAVQQRSEPTAAEPPSLQSAPEAGRPADARQLVKTSPQDGTQPGRDISQQRGTNAGATDRLMGVRSLIIDVDRAFERATASQVVEAANLGAQQRLTAIVWHITPVNYLAIAVATLVLLWGWLVTRGLRARARFATLIATLVVGIPWLAGWWEELQPLVDYCLLACVLLGVIGLANATTGLLRTGCQQLAFRLGQWFAGRGALRRTLPNVVLVIGVLSGWNASLSQTPDNVRPRDDDLQQRLLPPIRLPSDAVIIPYDPAQADLRNGSGRILVPYAKYVELWNRAHPEQPIQEVRPIADFALGLGQLEVTLADNDHLVFHGRIDVQVLTPRPAAVLLPFAGGVIARSLIDGQPATMQVVPIQPEENAPPPGCPSGLLVHIDKIGWHVWQFELHYPVERSGGWRVMQGIVPAPPATSLHITVPTAPTEVRMQGVADRSIWHTTAADQAIVTSLADKGNLQIQWRPKTDMAEPSGALTVTSDSVLDVLEDGLRLAWKGVMQFRTGRREEFTISIPSGYLVERVLGDNVRGWSGETVGDRVRLRVDLLRAAAEREEILLYLSRRSLLWDDQSAPFSIPAVHVEGASLEQGTLTVRAARSLELQILDQAGFSRTDSDPTAADQLVEHAGREPRLLPMRVYQAFRFTGQPYQMTIAARPLKPIFEVALQGVLRISERDMRWETRMVMQHRGAPLHRLEVELPASLEVEKVSEPQWVMTANDRTRRLTVYFRSGRSNQLVVDLSGKVIAPPADTSADVPVVRVVGAARQTSQWVVQVDPAYRVRVEELRGGEVIPLERTFSWLSSQQRKLAEGGVALEFASPDYAARLVWVRRQPLVRFATLTNASFTPEAIEETVFIELRVLEAGISEVSFTLPARFANARFRIPSLRQKTITPVEPPLDPEEPRVRVDVTFQDEWTGILRLMVEQDSPLTNGPHRVAIAHVLTGEPEHQFVTIQNTGQDEWTVAQQEGLDALSRHETSWRALADLQVTQGFAVRGDAAAAKLVMQAQTRPTLETVAARIAYAETRLVVDGAGGYRGRHELRVENRTEQYLEIELPEGAQLWAALVAGMPCKPLAPPQRAASGRVRIPLVKTEEGDTDYPVVLLYAGRMNLSGKGRPIRFPLVRTINVHTDLHQVSLYLPESYEWFDFRGAAPLAGAQEYASGYVAYLQDMVTRISQAAAKSKYKKARALEGLAQLEKELADTASGKIGSTDAELAALGTIHQAQQQLAEQFVPPQWEESAQQANRAKLQGLFQEQRATRAKNTAVLGAENFRGEETAPPPPTTPQTVNEKWFQQNKLLSDSPQPAQGAPDRQTPATEAQTAQKQVEQLRMLNSAVQSEWLGAARSPHPQVDRDDRLAAPGPRGVPAQDATGRGLKELSPPAYAEQRPRGTAVSPNGTTPGQRFAGGEFAEQTLPASAAPAETQDVIVPARQGLRSLEFQIPQRGRVYYLRGERGRVEITARSVHGEQVRRWSYGLGTLLVGLFVCWLLRPRRRRA